MRTILIVDDVANIRFVLNMALSEKYKVIEASNGIEGLQMFEQHNPDLIITDCNMPILSGIEFVRKVRAKNNSVKIIAHTAHLDNNSEMIEVGANICFIKPTSLVKLEQAINFLLLDN